jgi:hypothetical protein
MPSDFTVIMRVRHHFGDDEDSFFGAFVGRDEDFPFECPNVDVRQEAVLMFQSLSIDHDRHSFQLNDEEIAGGLPVSRSNDDWTGNIMLIRPNLLRATGNSIHIGARDSRGSILGNVDDFVIDNMVIMYKTRDRLLPSIPSSEA